MIKQSWDKKLMGLRLYKIFNPSGIVRMGFSIDNAQNVLSEFADVCVNDNGRWYGDLALYFAECATDFKMSFGDIDEDFYDILGDAYHDAVVAASDNEESPLLVFSEKGWEIEKETFAEELYQRFLLDIQDKNARVIFEMKDVNRQVVMLVLDKIEEKGTEEFLTCLEAWKLMEVKKVAARITVVENTIKGRIKQSE